MDASGNEFTLVTAIIVAVAIAVTAKAITNLQMGVPVWYGLGKSAVIGGVSGAISFGIGSAATSIATSFIGKAAFQAAAHAITGGFMSEIDGGTFAVGFYSGAISSIVSSGIQALGTNFTGRGALQDANRNHLSMNGFGQNYAKAVMVVSGGLTGGISSSIAGGNFWQGFRQGTITSGLNHVAHFFASSDIKVDRQTRKDFKEMVRAKNYKGAYALINERYNLDEGIEGKYTIGFPEDQKTPGLTGGDAFETQDVTISRSVFGGSVGHFIRVVHHEFVHVYQRGVLGFAGNLSIYEVREFLAYHDTFFNNKIPNASYSEMEGYWKNSRQFYDYMTAHPDLIKAYQSQYNDFTNSSFYRYNGK